MHESFNIMKTTLTADVLVAHSNNYIPYHIYKDDLDYPMGAIVSNKNM